MKRKILITVVMFLISSTLFAQKLSQEQAIELAEKFIADNGFTLAEPNKANLFFEMFEETKDTEEILKQRRNSLHPKAFCISNDGDGWDIGFLSTQIKIENLTPQQKDT